MLKSLVRTKREKFAKFFLLLSVTTVIGKLLVEIFVMLHHLLLLIDFGVSFC